ncbi:MAG TPA: type II CAAX endopeptidase family protein [Bryobacteraceae bacterium]|nr:type II CAAX endopeptidase family protein [Bryobacteraceae bacterium]
MIDEARPEPFWSWKDLLVIGGMGLPLLVGGALVASFAIAPITTNKAVRLLVPQFVGEALMLIPAAMLFRYKYDRGLGKALHLETRRGQALPSFAAGLGAAFAVLGTAAALRMPEMDNPMQQLMNEPNAAVWVGMFAVSVGPLFEEIFFRGLLQPVAVRTAGAVGGVLIAAVPFALLHGSQYAWSWRHVLLITMAGAAFGWWRVRTQSTGAATLMHAAYNGVLVVGFLIGRSAL